MDKAKTAVFIGHNECYEVNPDLVSCEIEKLIAKGVTDFLSGGQGGFDRLCSGCVHELKRRHPEIRNMLVIPYLSFTIFDRDQFDEVIYPDGFESIPYKAAIIEKNKYMVDNAGFAICYVNHEWGGAGKTFAYAKKKSLDIINLGSLE